MPMIAYFFVMVSSVRASSSTGVNRLGHSQVGCFGAFTAQECANYFTNSEYTQT